jgi:hypothetical protein
MYENRDIFRALEDGLITIISYQMTIYGNPTPGRMPKAVSINLS